MNLYTLYNKDYFKQPRGVCVVDEINPVEGGLVEILVWPPEDPEEKWIKDVARRARIQVDIQKSIPHELVGRVRFLIKEKT